MDRLSDRLVAADTDSETEPPPTDGEHSSDSVEWQDLSTETNGPTGWASGIDPEQRGLSESDDPETLAADRLVELILDGLAVPALVVDRAGEIAFINSAACEAFETTRGAAIGSTPTAVHGGQRLLEDVLSTGEEVVDHRETVVVGGTEGTLSRTIAPLEAESAGIVGAIETIRLLPKTSHEGDSDG